MASNTRMAPEKATRTVPGAPLDKRKLLFLVAALVVIGAPAAAIFPTYLGASSAAAAAPAAASPPPPLYPGMTDYSGGGMFTWGVNPANRMPEPFCPSAAQMENLVPIPPVARQATYAYANACEQYYADADTARLDPNSAAADWCRGGAYFTFRSGAGRNIEISGGGVKIWWRCDGSASNPHVLFVHGYPTSSWDTWSDASNLLKSTHYVCHVDHQGFGFSQKLVAPYYYSIYEHAAALNEFVTNVAHLDAFTMVTHDMGSSVGFAFLEKFVNPATALSPPAFTLAHHIITNGNVWLPFSSLSFSQLALLDNRTGPLFEVMLTSLPYGRSAIGALFKPPLGSDALSSLGTISKFQDGRKNTNDLNQYLQQRACWESNWLGALNASAVPATLVWGELDPVAGPLVADYVWNASLSIRPNAPARFLMAPGGGHYMCHDEPALFACLVRDPRGACTGAGSWEKGSSYDRFP